MASGDIDLAMGKRDTEDQEPLLGNEGTAFVRAKRSVSVWKVILVILLVVAVIALVAAILVGLDTFVDREQRAEDQSSYRRYRFAAVASDRSVCSTVGTDILARAQGSVVDAAIATLVCIGVHDAQSTGIGGGSLYTIYAVPRNGTKKTFISLFARERAPLAASKDMYNGSWSSVTGGKAVAVPGEVKGYYEAWLRFGRLPWADLFAPAIKMCRNGVVVGPSLAESIDSIYRSGLLNNTPSLREVFLKSDGTPYREGESLTRLKLADTLETIAKEGPDAFYDGSLSQSVIDDLNDIDSIITLEDLKAYKADFQPPVMTTLRSKGWNMYGPPPPSSGAVIQFILNVLDGYNLNPDSINDENKILTYHRISEALKFAYVYKSRLGDPEFVDISHILGNLTSSTFADYIRSKINDSFTQDTAYYGPVYISGPESGTSHMSLLGPDGSAVAITSTENSLFGCKRRGLRTGIIFNNEMDDFAKPISGPHWDIEASPSNFIEPGKRPLSSMSPTIITDEEGNVRFIAGASGGSKITPAVSYVAIHHILLGLPLHEAVDRHRLQHPVVPNELQYEKDFPQDILDGLKAKGHVLKQVGELAVVQAISTNSSYTMGSCLTKCIEAVSDRRKEGAPDGY